MSEEALRQLNERMIKIEGQLMEINKRQMIVAEGQGRLLERLIELQTESNQFSREAFEQNQATLRKLAMCVDGVDESGHACSLCVSRVN